MRRHAGFTMIEVAIMLAVLGLVLGLGVSLIGPLVKRSKLMETREAVKQAKEALVGFAVRNGYLPYEDPSYDRSRPSHAFEEVGVKGTDALGVALRYVAAPELQGDNSTFLGSSLCGTALRIDLCAENGTSLVITHEGTVRNNVAFMILSAGENQNLQTTTEIHVLGTKVDNSTEDGIDRREEYDDVVEYVGLDELRALRGCQKLEKLEIVTPQELPAAEEGQYYSYTLQANGGVSPYTWGGTPPQGFSMDQSGVLSAQNVPWCSESQLALSATVCDRTGQSETWSGWLPVRRKPLTITTVELPVGYEGKPYSAQIAADGGYGAYQWTLSVTPPCPGGLSCVGNGVSGVPASGSSGAYVVTATVSDQCGRSAQKNFGLTIHPAPPAGDNGTGGGGGGTIDVYRLSISNQGTGKSYRIANRSCVRMPPNYVGGGVESPGTVLTIFLRRDCTGRQILTGTMQNLDKNGDGLVRVSCIGRDRCDSI